MADIHQLKGTQRHTTVKPIAASHTDTLPYSSDYKTLSELCRPTIFKTPDAGKMKQWGQSKQSNYGNALKLF